MTAAELGVILGRPVDGARSALVFPYPGTDFCRYKLFPPGFGRDGRRLRYLQLAATGVHLYILPPVRDVLRDGKKPLFFTEGEKKAAKATQEGFLCVGLGGLWNWIDSETGQAIAELDGVMHVEREEVVVPDSDVWTRPDLLRPVYAFGKELEARGARVGVLVLPQNDETKVGLDDYLVQNPGGLDLLKRIPLNHKAFSQAADWWKSWSKRRRARADEPAGSQSAKAIEILTNAPERRPLRLAQDYAEGKLWFGVLAGNEKLVVNSDRELLRLSDVPEQFQLLDRGLDVSRWSKDSITRFLANETVSTRHLVSELRGFFDRFLVLGDRRISLLLALWALGTYVCRVFRVFPYLSLRSPMKRCGKSRVLDLLHILAFNASPRTTAPTEAQIFRGPSRDGGTQLLDEIERLQDDQKTNLVAVLNSGFERGGVVKRLEKRGETFQEVSFETYCPRALAGIRRLADALEDRCITIVMTRKKASERLDRFSPTRLESDAQTLRDSCYVWALTHAEDLSVVYEGIDRWGALSMLGDRERDLWEPLASIALLADAEDPDQGPTHAHETASLAADLSGVRSALEAEDSTTVRLISTLLALSSQKTVFRPTELVELIKEREGWDWLTSRKLAGLLHPLGFVSGSQRRGPETFRGYRFDPAALHDLAERYGGSAPDTREGDA